MPDLKAAALDYCRRGWSVIPIQPGGKIPLVPWRDYQNQRAGEEQIEAWWDEYPDANIGIVCGPISGLVVVDVDVERGGDASPIQAEAPTELVAQTGGGGYHLFYHHPPGDPVGNAVDVRPGVDVRGQGGYVVAPPSLHDSGERYRWTVSNAPGPRPPGFTSGQERSSPQAGEPPGGAGAGRDERWLVEYWTGRTKGSRDDSATRIAGYLESKGIPEDVTLEMLRTWNLKNDPPLPPKDVRKCVQSIYRTARREGQGPQDTLYAPGEYLDVLPLGDFLVKYGGKTVDWDIEEWLPASTILFTVAPPGSFKTWLSMDLAVSYASGKPFLDEYEVRNPGPVMVLQLEDPGPVVAKRLQTVMLGRYRANLSKIGSDGRFSVSILPNLPIYIHESRSFSFHDDNCLRDLEYQIRELGIELVVIDPLYYGASQDFDSYLANTIQRLKPLKDFRDKYGTTFCVCHHTAKGKLELSREGGWGSQYLNAFMETSWQIRQGEEAKQVSIARFFKDAPTEGRWDLTFDIETEDPAAFSYKVFLDEIHDGPTTNGSGPTMDPEAPYMKLLKTLGDGPKTLAEIIDDTRLDRNEVYQLMQNLEREGRVKPVEGRRYSLA